MTQTTKKTRRTSDQMIADLEAKIEAVRKRAVAKAAKSTDEGKLFLAAVKATDKALGAAQESGSKEMAHALESARASLGEHLIQMGVRAPVRRPRKMAATQRGTHRE